MTWNPIDEPIDYVLLADQRSPGIAEIRNANSPRRLRRRNGYGLSGATVIFLGLALSEPILVLRLYSREDWEGWQAWRPLVQRPPLGERARALDIWHPILEMQGIRSVLIEDVSQPIEDDDGVWTIEIKMVEYRRPEFTLSEPEGSQDTPTDPIDRLIDEQSATINQLGAELAGLAAGGS